MLRKIDEEVQEKYHANLMARSMKMTQIVYTGNGHKQKAGLNKSRDKTPSANIQRSFDTRKLSVASGNSGIMGQNKITSPKAQVQMMSMNSDGSLTQNKKKTLVDKKHVAKLADTNKGNNSKDVPDVHI